MTTAWLARFEAWDRTLFRRWALFGTASPTRATFWRAITRLGGPVCTLGLSTLPLAIGGAFAQAAGRALAVLAGSSLTVQIVKRVVGRLRPSRGLGHATSIREPDRFSFPSGHAAAAMAVAAAYTFVFPHLAPVLVMAAVLVGASRIVLGVHYPSDVLMGQAIAILTAAPILLWPGWP